MPNEVTITPLGIALGIAIEMGIVSKDDPNVLETFRNYWEQVEKHVLPYAIEKMKEKAMCSAHMDLDVNITIGGIRDVMLISNELHESVEKTKALAGALVKACDELNVTFDEH